MVWGQVIAAGAFGSAWMLAWSAAALLPVLLHLWNRHQYREAPWAAMRFLLDALEQQSRRLRIEQLLLLLIRVAIPIVLALALADPVWRWLPSLGPSLSTRPPHHHVFVVDTSYSMAYQVVDQSRLEESKARIRNTVMQSPEGDGFSLINLSDAPQAIIASPSFSKEDTLAEVDRLTTRDTVGDLVPCLSLVQSTLSQTKKSHPRLQARRVYFLSDFAPNTWDDADEPKARQTIGAIAATARCVAIDVAASNPSNAAILNVTRRNQIVAPTTTVAWQIQVRQWVGDQSSTYNVTLEVNGELVDRRTVSRAGGELQPVTMQHRFSTLGQHAVRFQLRQDGLDVDNSHHEIVTVRESVQVLCVEGKSGAARYVAHALSAGNELVETRTVPDYRFDEIALEEFDSVFFCNVAQFTPAQAFRLEQFVDAGNAVTWFVGDQVRAENYNRVLGQIPDGLLPAQLTRSVATEQVGLVSEDYQHPIVDPFRGQERAGLLTTPVWYHVQLVPAEPASIVAEFRGGDPAIVESGHQRPGRVVLFATAPSDVSTARIRGETTPWTAWHAWPSFVPIVQELLQYQLAGADRRYNLSVGDTIHGRLPANSIATQVFTLHHQDSTRQWRIPVIDQQGEPAWHHHETYWTGIYSTSESTVDRRESFAVNLKDHGESALGKVVLAELPHQYHSEVAPEQDEVLNPSGETTPLFRWLLGLLAALLVTESCVAWFLGNGRS